MKTNEQMAADLQERGRVYQAAKQRRTRCAITVASIGAVACLALAVFASGIFRAPVPTVSGDASEKAETAYGHAADPDKGTVKQYDTETDALPEGNADVNIPLVFGKSDAVKGTERGEAVLGKATVSPALRTLMEETARDFGGNDNAAYYVVTVDFSACFDGEAASGFEYEGKTIARYEEELQRYADSLPAKVVPETTASGTETAVAHAASTEEQKAELAARKAALTAAKAAYARLWADRIAERLRAAGWESTFAGADSAVPEDTMLAEGQVRTVLTAAQMAAVTCEADEGILFLPASKINGTNLTEMNAS